MAELVSWIFCLEEDHDGILGGEHIEGGTFETSRGKVPVRNFPAELVTYRRAAIYATRIELALSFFGLAFVAGRTGITMISAATDVLLLFLSVVGCWWVLEKMR